MPLKRQRQMVSALLWVERFQAFGNVYETSANLFCSKQGESLEKSDGTDDDKDDMISFLHDGHYCSPQILLSIYPQKKVYGRMNSYKYFLN